MRSFTLLVTLGLAVAAFAQNPQGEASPAAGSSTVRMSGMAIGKASGALRGGKAVTLTVDNRSVAYAPKLIGKMLYVPVRFFSETGQRVTWDGTDMRATVQEESGTQKNAIDYDAKRGQKNFRAGASMRPVYEKGRLWVPLASGLAAFGMYAEWVPTSSRLNVRTNRPAR